MRQLGDWLRAERELATADETGARTSSRQAIDKWSSPRGPLASRTEPGRIGGAQSNRLALVQMALLPSIERSAHSRGSYLNETFRRTR